MKLFDILLLCKNGNNQAKQFRVVPNYFHLVGVQSECGSGLLR